MTANINEAIQKIKRVGGTNTRIVPMAGQSIVEGRVQIEVRSGGEWETVVTGVTQKMAEDIVSQATNKVILG